MLLYNNKKDNPMRYTAKIQAFKKVHFLIRNISNFQYFFYNNRQYKVFTDIVRLNIVNNT